MRGMPRNSRIRRTSYLRWPSPIPSMPALRRSAPTVRFIALETLATGVRALEPIQEEWIHEQEVGLVSRLSMIRIIARRMKAATVGGEALEVASQAAIAADPCECSFDDPSFWQDDEAMEIGSLDDIDVPASGALHDVCHFWPLISSVGENALNKWEPAARFTQQGVGTVAILDIGG